MIAQDVQAVLPEAVNVQPDEDSTLGLSYTDVIPLLTAALKESITKIETLETEMTALKARVTALEDAECRRARKFADLAGSADAGGITGKTF